MLRSKLAASVAAAAFIVAAFAACGRQATVTTQPTPAPPVSAAPSPSASPVLPRGGRTIFPAYRVVAYYGTADIPALGTLGHGSPDEAGQRLLRQARAYERPGRHVMPAFELIATTAQASSNDGTYNQHLDDAQIERYLAAARKIHGLLILDVQPGRASFLPEVKRYERFLREPDVELALDSEWKMGPTEIPGRTIGGTDGATVNAVSQYLSALVAHDRLPQKLLIVHQFTPDMIEHRAQVVPRPGLAITFHVDGFGGRAAKLSKYHLLAVRGGPFFNGLKLFYQQDVDMFSARELLGLKPPPDLVTYQ
jgi:hypothetical protein